MARIAELTSHLQLADSKSVHFHAEVSMQAMTVNLFLNFPQAMIVSFNMLSIMFYENLFWNIFDCALACIKADTVKELFMFNKSFGSLVLAVLRSIMCVMYRFVHIS